MINNRGTLPLLAKPEPVDPIESLVASPLAAALLRTLFEQLPVGVLVADAGGRVMYENEIAHTLRATDAKLLDGPMARALLLGERVTREGVELVSRNRTRRWVSVSATPITGALGNIDVAVVTLADETALKKVTEWAPVIESLQRL